MKGAFELMKLDKIDKEMQRTREKIAEYQNRLKELDAQKTEIENLQIVQAVRAMRLTKEELAAFLRGDLAAPPQPEPAAAYGYQPYDEQDEQEDNEDE
jgi:dTDP-4-amino-4,6-dideoxygalactose transaminase